MANGFFQSSHMNLGGGTTGIQGVTGVGVTGIQGVTGAGGFQGLTGDKGARGATGYQGVTGDQGLQGSTGYQGITGNKGPDGSTGYRGATGLQGETGLQGSLGDTGYQGITGSKGPDGSTGYRGTTGLQGETGLQGVGGSTGLQGVDGSQGETGIGTTGVKGDIGTTGVKGDIGTTGLQGATGVGVTGLQGITGIEGERGDTGAQGLTGAEGLQGETGTQGITGIDGVQGDTGAQGLTGIMGPAGLTGAPGIQGDTGYQGPDGSTGYRGTTGLQGVTGISGGGTGLQGTTGASGGGTGLQGQTGIQGVTGSVFSLAYTREFDYGDLIDEKISFVHGFQTESVIVQVYDEASKVIIPTEIIAENNNVVTVDLSGIAVSGMTGIWRTNILAAGGVTGAGFTGMVNGLTGPQGETGLQGSTGLQGVTGISGGGTGLQGITGSQGTTGIQGGTGAPGIGYTGLQGVTGPSGSGSGETGLQGVTGISGGGTGLQGSTGLQGVTGISGVTGPIADTSIVLDYARMMSNDSLETSAMAAGNPTLDITWTASTDENTDTDVYEATVTGLRVKKAGNYSIKIGSTIDSNGLGQNRFNPLMRFLINGSEPSSPNMPESKSHYLRDSGGSNSTSAYVSASRYLDADDIVGIRLVWNGVNGNLNSIITEDLSFIEMVELDSEGLIGPQGVTGPFGGPQGDTGSQGIQGATGTALVPETFFASSAMMGTSANTIGLFSIHAQNANPFNNPITSSGGTFNNGDIDPIKVPFNWVVTEAFASVGSVAVSQGTVGTNPAMRVELFKHSGTSRSSIGDLDMPIDGTNCGVFNNIGGNNFQDTGLTGILGITGSAGDLIGWQFTNLSTNNELINSLARCKVVVKFEELGP